MNLIVLLSVLPLTLGFNDGITTWKPAQVQGIKVGYHYARSEADFQSMHVGYWKGVISVSGYVDSVLDIEVAQKMQNSNRSYMKKIEKGSYSKTETGARTSGIFAFITGSGGSVSKSEYKNTWDNFSEQEKKDFKEDMFRVAQNLTAGISFDSEIQVISSPSCPSYGHMLIRSHVVSDDSGNEFKLSFAAEKKMFDYKMAEFVKNNQEGMEQAKIDMMYLSQLATPVLKGVQRMSTNNGGNFACGTNNGKSGDKCVATDQNGKPAGPPQQMPPVEKPEQDAANDNDALGSLLNR